MVIMEDQAKAYYTSLVKELLKLPNETTWVEFKHNDSNPEKIGQYISALINSAALERKTKAYILWGIEDCSHDILGTTFNPDATKKGAQFLESWLLQLLQPRIDFEFFTVIINDERIILLEISPAVQQPVTFSGTAYIRIGEVTKALKEAPEKERSLWRAFDKTPYEVLVAKPNLSREQVCSLLDYETYYRLLNSDIPVSESAILNRFIKEGLVKKNESGLFDVLNLGAVLFANDFSDFSGLSRKSVRIIVYRGVDKTNPQKERGSSKGYAVGFANLIKYVNEQLPRNESMGQAFRKDAPMLPELCIRELIANALIHQDFFASGSNPMVEIYDDRMEITNPGIPLHPIDRLLGTPKSRNEALASLLRRIGICEERGSGIEKVILETESYQLPAPLFETPNDAYTRVVLFTYRNFEQLTKEDKIRACYYHASLMHGLRKSVTNATLRERFKIIDASKISRVLNDTIDAGLICIRDSRVGNKSRQYIPYWVK